MLTYCPENFASLYTSEPSQRIWSFLTRDDKVWRLETASQLSKPAVQGIEEQLFAEFREEILTDRVRQLVGQMVRQFQVQQDWALYQTDVKVQSVPFSKAARYCRPDWFAYHAFRHKSDPRDVAITDREVEPDAARRCARDLYATSSSLASRSIPTAIAACRSRGCCGGRRVRRR
ncbi:hypothetical protein [Marivivens aquimaris]|uniref:hypothetical protein n=1 Tax=Marivivens aquimaris TaxID=2774876 RepID=UPI001D166CE9|nr:hypothetical protein [Marivivens aquimaris]